jgi:hypothetical protein
MLAEALYIDAPYSVRHALLIPRLGNAVDSKRLKTVHCEIEGWGQLVDACEKFLHLRLSLNDVLFVRGKVWGKNRISRVKRPAHQRHLDWVGAEGA